MVDFDISKVTEDMVEPGDLDMKKIQTQGRVDIKDDWLDFLGLEVGQNVHLIVREDRVEIMQASSDNLPDSAGD